MGFLEPTLSLFGMDKSKRLLDAAQVGDYSVVVSLLDEGGDVNCQNSYGLTPLHCASANGHERVVSLLIERGADLNIKNEVRILSYLSLIYY